MVTEETSQTLLSSTHCSLFLSPRFFLHNYFLLFKCKRLVFKLDCYTVLDGILMQCYSVLDVRDNARRGVHNQELMDNAEA